MRKKFSGKGIYSYLVNSRKKLMFLKSEIKYILGKGSLSTLVYSLQQPSCTVTKFVNTEWYLNDNTHQNSVLTCTQVLKCMYLKALKFIRRGYVKSLLLSGLGFKKHEVHII